MAFSPMGPGLDFAWQTLTTLPTTSKQFWSMNEARILAMWSEPRTLAVTTMTSRPSAMIVDSRSTMGGVALEAKYLVSSSRMGNTGFFGGVREEHSHCVATIRTDVRCRIYHWDGYNQVLLSPDNVCYKNPNKGPFISWRILKGLLFRPSRIITCGGGVVLFCKACGSMSLLFHGMLPSSLLISDVLLLA